MELYLLRHAEAVPKGSSKVQTDSERPLTGEGRKRMAEIAAGMKTLKLCFDVILTSPFVRARETAEIAAKILGLEKKLKQNAHLVPDGDHTALVEDLTKLHPKCASVLLVGHEPHLSQFMSRLLVGSLGLAVNFKKAGLAKLSVDELKPTRCATLEWLLTPRQLEWLAGADRPIRAKPA